MKKKDTLQTEDQKPDGRQTLCAMLSPIFYKPLKRFGPIIDGGYVLAPDVLAHSGTVYSYGVGERPNECEFDFEMASIGKTVYLYDGTVERPAQDHANFRFKRENVDSRNFITHLTENGDLGERNLTLKMDIEGDEYETLLNCDDEIFDHFSQIAIEVHGLLEILEIDPAYPDQAQKRQIRLIRRLLGRYQLVHIHANNYGAFCFGLPDVIELLFVRNDYIYDVQLKISSYSCPREGLDFPNDPTREDIYIDWWTKEGNSVVTKNQSNHSQIPRQRARLGVGIPKLIHQSWKDTNIPYEIYPQSWQESWKLHHPDWEYRFWTDQANRELVRCHYPQYLSAFDSLDLGIKRADFCRFLYMHRYGGLYADLDFVALRDQSPLLEGARIVVGTLSMGVQNLWGRTAPGMG